MKKHIHIITVYDSMNYGSYFQAKSLQSELSKYGDADFLDINHQSTRRQTIKRIVKDVIRFKLDSCILELKKYKVFSSARKQLDITKYYKSGDYFVFGSDEIWNIRRKKIKKSKEFFGVGLPEQVRIAAAPSINQSTFEEMNLCTYIREELSKFQSISVRDIHSKEVIDKITGKKSVLVGDPVLLLSKEQFVAQSVPMNYRNYIVIYTYGKMLSEQNVQAIISFSKEKKLMIISVGKWVDFCDKCICPSPGEFLGLLNAATYVFTDTFHGTMFSLIFEKQFVVFPCGNTKVETVLDMVGANRVIYNNNLIEHCQNIINYKEITPKLREYGDALAQFLNEAFQT